MSETTSPRLSNGCLSPNCLEETTSNLKLQELRCSRLMHDVHDFCTLEDYNKYTQCCKLLDFFSNLLKMLLSFPSQLGDYLTHHNRIYLNKHSGPYLIFRATSVALIRARGLFKHCTRQIYFFYIFIQRYTFYLLIFLWTDTKLIVNLELREIFTR